MVVGCNVENASYGLTLCAECGLASALHASGGGRLVAISVVGEDGRHLAPCGRCRQVLWEVGGPTLLMTAVDVIDTVAVTDAVPILELPAVPMDPVAG